MVHEPNKDGLCQIFSTKHMGPQVSRKPVHNGFADGSVWAVGL